MKHIFSTVFCIAALSSSWALNMPTVTPAVMSKATPSGIYQNLTVSNLTVQGESNLGSRTNGNFTALTAKTLTLSSNLTAQAVTAGSLSVGTLTWTTIASGVPRSVLTGQQYFKVYASDIANTILLGPPIGPVSKGWDATHIVITNVGSGQQPITLPFATNEWSWTFHNTTQSNINFWIQDTDSWETNSTSGGDVPMVLRSNSTVTVVPDKQNLRWWKF